MRIDDPFLTHVRHALDELYGDRLARVVLFGSRARGDATDDSDYDLAVFLKDMPDRWAEIDRLADLRVTFLENNEPFIDAFPYLATAYGSVSLPLMHEIRREGVEI